jgi:multiple antibiotic resistance protein
MNPEAALRHVLHDLPTAATATFLALLPIVNPLGGIPLFFSLTANFPAQERRSTALKTSLYVIAILIIFMLFGRFVLNFFGISLPVLKIAGGLIVANTAWGMVTGSSRMTMEESSEALTKQDISLTPMAMPMLSGPGSIGVVMGLAAHADNLLAYAGDDARNSRAWPDCLPVPLPGRPIREAPRPRRSGRDQPHFRLPDSGDRGAVGVGRRGGLQGINQCPAEMFKEVIAVVGAEGKQSVVRRISGGDR